MIFRQLHILSATFFIAMLLSGVQTAQAQVYFNPDIIDILTPTCTGCHGSVSGFNATTYANAAAGGTNCSPGIVPFDAAASSLYDKVSPSPSCGGAMPPSGAGLSVSEVATIQEWINAGALESASVTCADLMLSAYVEGSSFNKCIEIYNGTGAAVDLSTYTLDIYNNGNTEPNFQIELTGTLENDSYFLICHDDVTLSGISPNQLTGDLLYNGDDAIVLNNGTANVDAFGQIGFQPDDGWAANDCITENTTWVKNVLDAECKYASFSGNIDFEPFLGEQWTCFGNDVVDVINTFNGCDPVPEPINVVNAAYFEGNPIPTLFAEPAFDVELVINWYDNPAAEGEIVQIGNEFTPSEPGCYYAFAINITTTCLSNAVEVCATEVPPIVLSESEPICDSDFLTYRLPIAVTGGTAPYEITFDDEELTLTDLGDGNYFIDNIPSGTSVTVTVTDANGLDSTFITEPTVCEPPVCPEAIELLQESTMVCNNFTVTLPNSIATTNNELATFSWIDEAGNIIAAGETIALLHSGTSCIGVEETTFFLLIGCTTDESYEAGGGFINVMLQPAINEDDFILPEEGTCTTEITDVCGDVLQIEYSTDGGESFTSTPPDSPAPGESITIDYQVFTLNEGTCALTGTYQVDCPATCPELVLPTGAITDLTVCNGEAEELVLEVAVVDGDASNILWSDGSIGSAITVSDLVNTGDCEGTTYTFTATIAASEDCEEQSIEFTITVLADPGTNAEVLVNNCGATLINYCPQFMVSYMVENAEGIFGPFEGDSYQATYADASIVTFMVSDPTDLCPIVEAEFTATVSNTPFTYDEASCTFSVNTECTGYALMNIQIDGEPSSETSFTLNEGEEVEVSMLFHLCPLDPACDVFLPVDTTLSCGTVITTGDIEGALWVDLNNNGEIDDEEELLADISLTLTDASGNTFTTTSDDNGAYTFNELEEGCYDLVVGDGPLGSIAVENTQFVCVIAGETNLVNFAFVFLDLCLTDPILINTDEINNCTENTYNVILLASGGGTPDIDFTVIVNNEDTLSVAADSLLTIGPFDLGSPYNITVLDGNECSESTSGTSQCTVNVDLLSFTGKIKTEGNVLQWTTATETNNSHFTLLYANDGINFSPITQIEGQGTSNVPQVYRYLHANNHVGTHYYQLVQTDFDGTSTVISVISLHRQQQTSLQLTSIYPQPNNGLVNITGFNTTGEAILVELYDTQGRLVFTNQQSVINSNFNIQLNTSQFCAGMYILQISSNMLKVTDKIICK